MRDDKLLLLLSQIFFQEEATAQLQVAAQHFFGVWVLFDEASNHSMVEIDSRTKNWWKIAEVGCRAIDAELSIIESYWQSQSVSFSNSFGCGG